MHRSKCLQFRHLPYTVFLSNRPALHFLFRLFDKKANGQVRGFAILEGKKKVTEQELKQLKAVEVVMHFHAPTED